MDERKILVTHTELELPHRFDEGRGFDVTDGTAKLDDADVWLFTGVVDRDFGDALDPILDGVGDVRDDLRSQEDRKA